MIDTLMEARLDARLAIGVFVFTTAARLAQLRFANTPRDVWNATRDIAFAGAVIHAAFFFFRFFAEILQFHLWPEDMLVVLRTLVWLLLIPVLVSWVVAMNRWIIEPLPGQPPAIPNEGTAP